MKIIHNLLNRINSNIPKNYVYVPIGNFYFLDETLPRSKDFSYQEPKCIQDYLDYLIIRKEQTVGMPEDQKNAHSLSNYESLLRRSQNLRLPFGSYLTFQDLSESYGDTVHTFVVERQVKFRLFNYNTTFRFPVIYYSDVRFTLNIL